MNPLQSLFEAGLPEMDVGVMSHGLADHGRDYILILEDSISHRPGTYRLTFTHVVELNIRTAVDPEAWTRSWSDDFTDYQRWEAAGEPDGYVFGTNWSLAYPGFTVMNDSPLATEWTSRLNRPMFAASLETNRFSLKLVFHDAKLELIDDDTPTVSRVIFPIK